jgi:hypothetical protein
MLLADIDDLVLDSDEDSGIEELGRKVLARGPWTTVAFLVRTRAAFDAPWEGPFLWLHRYQKVPQGWKLVSHFRTTGAGQTRGLLSALEGWKEFLASE